MLVDLLIHVDVLDRDDKLLSELNSECGVEITSLEFLDGPASVELIQSTNIVSPDEFKHAQALVSTLKEGRRLVALAEALHPWTVLAGYNVADPSFGWMKLSTEVTAEPTVGELYDVLAGTAVPIGIQLHPGIESGLTAEADAEDGEGAEAGDSYDGDFSGKTNEERRDPPRDYGWGATFIFANEDDAERIRAAFPSLFGYSV